MSRVKEDSRFQIPNSRWEKKIPDSKFQIPDEGEVVAVRGS
jgi:hypothetical protein